MTFPFAAAEISDLNGSVQKFLNFVKILLIITVSETLFCGGMDAAAANPP
jgi:hypothetical protein